VDKGGSEQKIYNVGAEILHADKSEGESILQHCGHIRKIFLIFSFTVLVELSKNMLSLTLGCGLIVESPKSFSTPPSLKGVG